MDKIKNITNKLWALLKMVMKEIFVTISIIILFIIAVIIAVTLIFSIPCTYDDFKYNKFRHPQPFNLEKWKAAFLKPDGKEMYALDTDEYQRFDRCYMYKDLIKNNLHFDMSYEEVVKLLGRPEEVIYFVNPEMKRIYYFLGYCTKSSCGYNPVSDLKAYYISFYFDKNLKLIAYGLQKGELGSITYDKRPSLKKTKRLFSCDTEPGYYKTIDCVRGISEITKTGGVHTHYEYCKIDEVKAKWGYEVW